MGAAESTGRPNGTTEREEEEQRRRRQQESGGSFTEKAATAATLAAGVAVAAWGISRILSNNTKSDEENDDTAIKSTNPSIRESIRGDRFISTVTDRGYYSTKGQSSGYYGGIISQDDGGISDVVKQLSTWSPPPRGQFKMNTDGACKPHPGGLGGYGGILRNDRGDFVCCFYGFIGLTDSLTAELRGILEGLKILESRRFMGSILETDCQAACQFVKGGRINKKITDECRDMIRKCVKLIGDNNIIVEKIEGKHNKCADKLADMAIKVQDDVEYHDVHVIPREIKSLIDEDKP